mmetsp:Transcript_39808/g.92125  ORF Transcript_39808/g.92125 Transcript_39808/m.92125 type:complete len:246 (-) Transcript_39808:1771-2508(-)
MHAAICQSVDPNTRGSLYIGVLRTCKQQVRFAELYNLTKSSETIFPDPSGQTSLPLSSDGFFVTWSRGAVAGKKASQSPLQSCSKKGSSNFRVLPRVLVVVFLLHHPHWQEADDRGRDLVTLDDVGEHALALLQCHEPNHELPAVLAHDAGDRSHHTQNFFKGLRVNHKHFAVGVSFGFSDMVPIRCPQRRLSQPVFTFVHILLLFSVIETAEVLQPSKRDKIHTVRMLFWEEQCIALRHLHVRD